MKDCEKLERELTISNRLEFRPRMLQALDVKLHLLTADSWLRCASKAKGRASLATAEWRYFKVDQHFEFTVAELDSVYLMGLVADDYVKISTARGYRYYRPTVAGIKGLNFNCYVRAGENYFSHVNEAEEWHEYETNLLDWLFFIIFLGMYKWGSQRTGCRKSPLPFDTWEDCAAL